MPKRGMTRGGQEGIGWQNGHEILRILNKNSIIKKCKDELQTAEIRATLVVWCGVVWCGVVWCGVLKLC